MAAISAANMPFDTYMYLISFLESTELLSEIGIVRIVELLLQTAVDQDMHHLSLLHVLQTQTHQLLETVHIILG